MCAPSSWRGACTAAHAALAQPWVTVPRAPGVDPNTPGNGIHGCQFVVSQAETGKWSTREGSQAQRRERRDDVGISVLIEEGLSK